MSSHPEFSDEASRLTRTVSAIDTALERQKGTYFESGANNFTNRVLNDTVYAASGPALLRAIAGNVLGSDAAFSMLQLRTWFGDDLADGLVRRFEEGEEEIPVPSRVPLLMKRS